MLDSIAQWAEQILLAVGYPGLGLLVFAENLCPPIPSELILPLAGFEVAKGSLSYPLAVLASTVGSVLGALAIYALGRHGGRPLLQRHHRLLRLRDQDLDRADAWFERRGPWAVLIGRVVPGVRSVVSFPAGMAAMRLRPFILLTAAGSAVWNALLIGAGWQLGRNYDQVAAVVGSVSNLVLFAAAGTVVAGGVLVWRRRAAFETGA